MTPAERVKRNIRWIEAKCCVPEGKLISKPVQLSPAQRQWMEMIYGSPTRMFVCSLPRKNGKGLALDTPLPTPSGWKTIGDVREGDTLFDEQGQPCTVLHLSPVHIGLRCWRLTFSDGSSVVADEQHRWMTTDRWRGLRITTTPEIATHVRIHRSDGGVEFRHSIAVAKCLRSQDVALPLDSYLLGCWLGDGSTDTAMLSCGDVDVEHFRRAIGDGLSLEPVARRQRTAWALRFSAGRGGPRSTTFQAGLRQLGVLGDKHIPERYLWSGTEQRRALLQGLMDTDGTITPTGKSGAVACAFSGCNERLVRQVLTLARGLGLKSTIRSRAAKLRGVEVNTVYEVQFTAWADDAPFRLERKAERLKLRPVMPTRSASVQIVACEEVDSVPTRCLQVSSSSSLFLCGEGMVPTHNTTFSAMLVLLHLVGPEAVANSQLYSAAQSRDQAAILFALAAKMVRLSHDLSQYVTVRDTAKQLVCRELGTIYRALSADASTAYGLSPAFVVHDELGQVKGPRSDLYEALETASAAQEHPLSIVISTQSPSPNDLMSKLIDDAMTGEDARIKCVLYAVPTDADPFDAETLSKAQPNWHLMNQSEVLKMASDAQRMPSREPSFRNLVANQRVEARSPFVSRTVWEENGAHQLGELSKAKVWGGLDLSSVSDLTALVLCSAHGGAWDVWPTFWLPEDGLFEKDRVDKVPYIEWKKNGYLQTTPGAAIQYEFIAEHLRGVFDRCDVQALAFDRYNMKFLKPWLERAGFSPAEMEKFVEHGQGYISMSPAIRELESLLLSRRLRHAGHPTLTMCAMNATVIMDPAENRKFVKGKATGRIDGLIALTMAVGVMPRVPDPPKKHQLLFF